MSWVTFSKLCYTLATSYLCFKLKNQKSINFKSSNSSEIESPVRDEPIKSPPTKQKINVQQNVVMPAGGNLNNFINEGRGIGGFEKW